MVSSKPLVNRPQIFARAALMTRAIRQRLDAVNRNMRPEAISRAAVNVAFELRVVKLAQALLDVRRG